MLLRRAYAESPGRGAQLTRRIDLHTHSTASDGTDSPTALVLAAAAAGLDVVALTDHDTTAGWDEAAAARPSALALVRGAEISCVRAGISLHLLAYLFDPSEPAFAAEREALRVSRVGRARQMVDLLAADGHPVTWEQVEAHAGGTVGRPHIARVLIEAGLVGSVTDAFGDAWIGNGGRYWVAKKELDVVDAVRLVVDAGGVAVFAHPAASKRGRVVDTEVIREMAAAGLAGLEVDHVDQDADERAGLRAVAAELGLLTTGSSDYHGTHKTVRLGAHLTDPAVLDALVSRASGAALLSGAEPPTPGETLSA